MNILLIQPPMPENRRHKKAMPLGIAYLASYLKKLEPHIDIEILDAHVLDLNFSEIINHIGAKKRHIVGLTYWTLQAPAAFAISRAVKELDCTTTVIHGGVHATCLPEESLLYADYCVLGEGEETFFELVKAIQSKEKTSDITGIAYKNGDKIVKNPLRSRIETIDEIPFPAWNLLHVEKYDTPFHIGGGKRLPVIGSRGCPYQCTFCVSPIIWQRTVRWRNPEKVAEEMKMAVEKYGINQFHFWDDNLMMNRDFVTGLCEAITRMDLNVKWLGLTRASHIIKNSDLLEQMKLAGCVGMEIGIESANPQTYQIVHKGEGLSEIEQAFSKQREAGLSPMFTFMTFNPGENITGYYMQAKFIQSKVPEAREYYSFERIYPVALGQFATPHVGTQFYLDAEKQGIILTRERDKLFHHNVNFIPNSLLDDIPIKTAASALRESHKIALREALDSVWTIMRTDLSRKERYIVIDEYLRFADYFYTHFDGKRSVRELSERSRAFFNMEEKKSLVFSAIITVAVAQLGLARSALYFLDTDVKPQSPRYGYVTILRSYLLRTAGRILGLLGK